MAKVIDKYYLLGEAELKKYRSIQYTNILIYKQCSNIFSMIQNNEFKDDLIKCDRITNNLMKRNIKIMCYMLIGIGVYLIKSGLSDLF